MKLLPISLFQLHDFLNNVSITNFADVVAFNKSILDMDWLSSELLERFRDEFQIAEQAWKAFTDLEQSPDFYYHTLDQVIEKFKQSAFLDKSVHHTHAVLAKKVLTNFTNEINLAFLRPHTYFSTFEVSDRLEIKILIRFSFVHF